MHSSNHLDHYILDDAKKNSEDQPPGEKGKGHAFLVTTSFHNTWVLDLGVTCHMDSLVDSFSHLETCTKPPYFWEMTHQWRLVDKGE